MSSKNRNQDLAELYKKVQEILKNKCHIITAFMEADIIVTIARSVQAVAVSHDEYITIKAFIDHPDQVAGCQS